MAYKKIFIFVERNYINMKKIVLILLTAITLGLIVESCRSPQSCPAYGEARKFQIEQRH